MNEAHQSEDSPDHTSTLWPTNTILALTSSRCLYVFAYVGGVCLLVIVDASKASLIIPRDTHKDTHRHTKTHTNTHTYIDTHRHTHSHGLHSR